MKVLKQPPEFKGVHFTCACGAVILADALDDFTRHVGGDQRDSFDYLTVNCPCCGTSLRMESTKFPAYLLGKIKRDTHGW